MCESQEMISLIRTMYSGIAFRQLQAIYVAAFMCAFDIIMSVA